MNKIRSIYYALRLAIVACSFCIVPTASATLALSESPLYLLNSVDPNVLLTFDDSGSMAWGFLPDPVYSFQYQPEGCSSTVNRMYYDPTITYTAGVDSSGTSLGNASFTGAWIVGYNHSLGTVDLSTGYQAVWSMDPDVTTNTLFADCGTGVSGGQAAYYFVYTPTLPTCSPVSTATDGCYQQITVSATSGVAPHVDERQNFANWYSYYRVRTLSARTAIGRAFGPLGTNIRVAAQHINNTITTAALPRFTTTIGPMAPFSGTARTDFFTKLYNAPAQSSTPLRTALKNAGDYFSTAGPYQDVPGTNPELSCRQNFNVVMTDGYWNGTAGLTGNIDNTSITLPDGTSFTAPMPPYSDATSDTLADNAFYYWSHDLRPALTNNVPPYFADNSGTPTAKYWNPKNDPATWQHMVNFTIGLGIDGDLVHDTATYNNLVSGVTPWSAACADCASAVDDLWHTAINSRGQYFSAANPQQLVDSFATILSQIKDRMGSSTAVTLSGGKLSSGTQLYQPRFNSETWAGQLFAYPIDATTGAVLTSTPAWEAGVKLNTKTFTNRSIITYNDATHTGVPFQWTNISAAEQAALNTNAAGVADAVGSTQGLKRLEYLRGSSENEGTGFNYRVRTCYNMASAAVTCPANVGKLGDIVDSGLVYQGPPAHHYPDSIGPVPYSTFLTTYQSRPPMIYVGANDGMLHAFDAASGDEKFAYVPAKVYPKLTALTGVPYQHRSYVDGTPTTGDVVITRATSPTTSISTWKTVLVGGLRKGGQGYYALDVTDPATFDEPHAANIALWEFTDADDSDLGYSYGQPSIVKMANGRWAAIFGNGYNSDESDGHVGTGHAVLYIVFIDKDPATGAWVPTTSTTAGDFVKIDTGVGGNGTTLTANGLASPSVVDVDGDNVADFIYAGDLRGNLWKFDVTSTNPSDWATAANRRVLFTARDAANNEQPITSAPMIGRHPEGLIGYMVYFGTGKYLETSDISPVGATPQTFYGVWDKESKASKLITPPVVPPAPTRADLLPQTVVAVATVGADSYRVVSNTPMIWSTGTTPPTPSYLGWYLDLPTTGEKQVTDSVLREGRIIFTTLEPSGDRCVQSGGWLMELDAKNGGRLDSSPFDVNGDGVINSADLRTITSGSGTVQAAVSGQHSDSILSAPAILSASPPPPGGACMETKFLNRSDGTFKSIVEACNPNGRKSWRQLQ